MSVLKLLNRHNIVFGDYKWTEFDDAFLSNNVQSVSIVDTELKLKDRQVFPVKNVQLCSCAPELIVGRLVVPQGHKQDKVYRMM